MPQAPARNGAARPTPQRPCCPATNAGPTDAPPASPAFAPPRHRQAAAPLAPPVEGSTGHGPTTTPPLPDASTADPPPPGGGSGRDARGRFTKGNAGGPGNPFARRTARLHQALCARVTEEDIEAVADQLVARARQGDLAAAKLLLAYVIGKPAVAVDPDSLDHQEWRLYHQDAVTAGQMTAVLGGIPAGLANTVARAAVPILTAQRAQELAQQLKTDLPPEAGAPSPAPAAARAGSAPSPFPRPEEGSASAPTCPAPPKKGKATAEQRGGVAQRPVQSGAGKGSGPGRKAPPAATRSLPGGGPTGCPGARGEAITSNPEGPVTPERGWPAGCRPGGGARPLPGPPARPAAIGRKGRAVPVPSGGDGKRRGRPLPACPAGRVRRHQTEDNG
jgi:hypothetical protein